VVFGEWHRTGRIDVEAVEMLVRDSMHHAGAAALSRLLSMPVGHAAETPCPCGQAARYHDTRAKQLLSVVGAISIERAYYVCPHCGRGQSPRDGTLEVEGTAYTPGVQRMIASVGGESSFHQGRQQLYLLAGLEVTTKAVERQAEAIGADIAQRAQQQIDSALQLEFPQILGSPTNILYIEIDGTQVPMVRTELRGRPGRIEGQPARTREMKLACVFTQTTTDAQGRPVRDPDSTTYTGAIETADPFGRRIYTEAWERGWSRAKKKVVLGDGAEWIWNIANQHFVGAIQIVDIWHARQHLWDVAAKLFSSDERERKRWAKRLTQKLNAGKVEAVVSQLRQFPTRKPELRETLRMEAEYFERNQQRMRYPKFRRQGLFFGSGVIEAGCKTVVGARLKQSGMFWTVRGANAIIALRCTGLSRKFEDYWVSRAKAA
jgi:hypothetical protein